MPIYANVADIRRLVGPKILIQLADDDQNNQPENDVVEAAIERAEGLVDAALGAAGYSIPVALPIPAGAGVIKAATCWLAVCDLAARKGVIPDDYKTQCDLYASILAQIRDGQLGLPLPAGAINMPHSSTEGQEKVFTRTKRDTGTGDVRNPDELHSLDGVNTDGD